MGIWNPVVLSLSKDRIGRLSIRQLAEKGR
jgi:hypothetical protein